MIGVVAAEDGFADSLGTELQQVEHDRRLGELVALQRPLETGSDKRAQADALLDRAATPGTKMRDALADEAKALTSIGNSLRIRHSEVTQEVIDRSEQLDWLFVRMFGFVRLLLLLSGRGAHPTSAGGSR